MQALAAGQGDAYIAKLQAAVNGWADASTRSSAATDENASRYAEYLEKAVQGQSLVDHLTDTTDTLSESLGINANSAEYTARAQEALGISSSDTDDSMADLVNTTQSLADTLFGGANASASFESAMYDLGNSLYTNGADFSAYSEAGRANLSALATVVNAAASSAGDDANALATYLTAIINSLSGYGVNVAALFPQLVSKAGAGNVNKLNAAMSQQSVTAGYAAAQNKSYASSAKSAGKSASAAAEKVYTLTNYVSDLSSVMKSAFDIRWGLDKSIDDVADAFQKLVDMKQDAQDAVTDAFSGLDDAQQNVTDLRRDLAGLNADIQGLNADRATLTYQLGVARDYGDTLRENEILAELAKNQEDISDKENDRSKTSKNLASAQAEVVSAANKLASAQADLNRTLDGGTASSREQRAAVLALVQSYQQQITSLANTGLNQQQLAVETEKLRAKFYDQMQQLGYNRIEAEKYAKSFDDIRKVIAQIPRNITITANLDPATRAVNEWRANNTGGRGASAPIDIPVRMSGGGVGNVDRLARQQDLLQKYTDAVTKMTDMSLSHSSRVWYSRAANDYLNMLRSGNFAEGGYTGRGGKYDPAGVVHKGEFVVPKSMVNQSTGLPYANALGAITQGFANGGYVRSAPSVRFPSTQIVELSPTDRALLAAAGNVTVTMDGRVVAMATNANNINQSRRG